MESLSRSPSKAEAFLAVVLSLVAASVFGAVAAFIWFVAPAPSPIAMTIFTGFFLASVILVVRAAFTSRRVLTRREATGLAWVLAMGGACGAIASLLLSPDLRRGPLLAASLSCLAYGLAGLRGSRK